nr:PAS domain-containing sensor histidine kinase [Desulfobacter vibrioformis]
MCDSTDGILVVDPQGTVLFLNPAAEKILQRKKNVILGTQLGLPTQDIGRVEIDMLVPNGDTVPVELWANNTVWEDKPAIRVSVRDLSLQRSAENALRRSQEFLNETARIAMIGGWELDVRTNAIRWTDMTRHIHGVSEEYMPNLKDSINFFPPANRSTVENDINRAVELGISFDKEFPLITASNQKAWVRFIGKADFRKKKCVRIHGIYQDITERKIADDQFKLSQIKLMQAEKMSSIGTLAAGIAHELNNPLMGILNYVQYALKKLDSENKLYEVMKNAETATKDCISLVRNLLTFSHQDTGEKDKKERVFFPEAVGRVLELLDYRIVKTGVTLIKDFDEKNAVIKMSSPKLQQILMNLLSNAIDAVETCDKKEIRLSFEIKNDHAFIIIEDSGPGINADHIERIFDPFFSTKEVGKGTGLGLSISFGIIKEYNGEIVCRSKVNEGTSFTITIPHEDLKSKENGA